MGVEIKDININPTSIRRIREKERENSATDIRENFHPDDILTIHWDGKIVPALSGTDRTDRQAIIVTGETTSQLLGAPLLERATGKAIAESIAKHLKMWGITDNIKAMCFDTTSVNPGWKNGAATWLEHLLEKNLLWLPCRHHILELLLETTYHTIMGPSTGPEVDIFKRFQKEWKHIAQSDYSILDPCDFPTILDFSRRESTINFAETQIHVGQPRDDYLELLELVIIFLGGVPPKGVSFRQPGPMHAARWMAKAIYSLKTWLFRTQFQLTKEENVGLLNVCYFIASVYIEAWFAPPFAASAPRSDLQLVARIQEFSAVHPTAASSAQKKLSAHLWYLSEELMGLSVFDEGLADAERESLVAAIHQKAGSEDPMKKRQASSEDLLNAKPGDLATVNTAEFFRVLGISTDFFDSPADSWMVSASYRHGKAVVNGLKVVNDHAERGVKLIKDYNKSLTRKEEGFQDLLVNVSEHRKSLPDLKKRHDL